LCEIANAQLLITEIMFDPFGNNEHEYVEIYNASGAVIDLSNYSLKVNEVDNKLAEGSMISAGGIAVIVRTDNVNRPLQNYIDAWGEDVNFIETANEGGLPLWQTLGNTGSNVEILDDVFNVVVGVAYDADSTPDPPWPGKNDMSSIYLTDLNAADPTDGVNWALSADGVDGARFGNSPRTGDVGSPGFVPGLSTALEGDFNGDGSVDAADYVVWRKNLGGIHTPDDYNTWRAHFGQTAGSGAITAATPAAVPEPATLALLFFSAMTTFARLRLRRRVCLRT
jgi:hypothetical protein